MKSLLNKVKSFIKEKPLHSIVIGAVVIVLLCVIL